MTYDSIIEPGLRQRFSTTRSRQTCESAVYRYKLSLARDIPDRIEKIVTGKGARVGAFLLSQTNSRTAVSEVVREPG